MAAAARPAEPDPAVLAAELESATRDKADFSLAGLDTDVKVVDVYDGDTLRVKLRLFGRLVQFKARMTGYDSPEMTGAATEEKAAVAARDALAARLGGKCVVPLGKKKAVFTGGRVVRGVFGKFDKYGRPLVTLYADGTNLNQWMVDQGYGYVYSGGTKKKFGAA